MTNRIESKIPFVGLHAHSGLSPFDGLGMPGEHMDFAYENGMNAHALTDHGHMNGLSFQVEHLKKMKEGGKWMLYIPSELAYGERGSQGAIGPNEVLVFEVELLSIQ